MLLGRRGQPAGWSPFANDAGSYNVAVTGKSVLMQELVSAGGAKAVVIDDGRSFQHTAEALGGAFIAFGRDAACLNPFAMIDAAAAQADDDFREECFSRIPDRRGPDRTSSRLPGESPGLFPRARLSTARFQVRPSDRYPNTQRNSLQRQVWRVKQ